MKLLPASVSLAAAAKRLGVHRGTVARLIESGELRAWQLTGSKGWWQVEIASLEKMIEKKNREALGQ